MNNNKNLIIALVLSVLIMLVWQQFYVKPRADAAREYAASQQQATQTLPATLPQQDTENKIETEIIEEPTKIARRINIKSDKLEGSIYLKGARIDNLSLLEYKQENKADSPAVKLFQQSKDAKTYFAEFGWLSGKSNIKTPNSKTIWDSNDEILSPENPLTLFWDNQSGLKFIMKISMDDKYLFTVEKSVENYGADSAILYPYGILNRNFGEEGDHMAILHEGPLSVFDSILKEDDYGDLKEDKKYEYKNVTGWFGLSDKYWLSAIIPDQTNSFNSKFSYFLKDSVDRFQVDYLGQKTDLEPSSSTKYTSHLYAGPKQLTLLEEYGKALNIPLFDRAVDFGWLYFITKPIFKLLTLFYHVLGNFGLAILLLTVLIKLFLFPLANKSYVSMHHLKRLQPQMMDLREKYKHDKMQLNQQVMQLYKDEKVNPMAGCLPILVQIPIFFALYKVLYVTIEMRHAPFYGWISDLSAPDPTTIFNLFGLIPWDPPSFFMTIGLWPVIMTVSMYVQQMMSPKPSDPTQAIVMKALPFIFIFLFASFPAGLVIYWSWNNILSVLQQWVITRRLPK